MKTNALRIGSWGLVAAGLMICSDSAWGRKGPKRDTAPDYTIGEKPATWDTEWAIGPTGAFGYFYYKDARQVLIRCIADGSPAHGNLRTGDVILGVLSPTEGQGTNDGKFAIEARHAMARGIEQAQKKENGGKLVLNVWRPEGELSSEAKEVSAGDSKRTFQPFIPKEPLAGKTMPVTLTLPVMGSYSTTSPWDCEKTKALIDKSAEAVLKDEFFWINRNGSKMHLGIYTALEALGLLATGEEAHMPRVREFAHKLAGNGRGLNIYSSDDRHHMGSWHAAYYNVFLCEYYLLTQDESVLTGIEGFSKYLATGVSGVGSWGHGVAYVNEHGLYGPPMGYGAMNQCSAVCALSLVLAQKCGIENEHVDKAVELALDYFRFYVDKGVIPYGDHEPAVGKFDENGRMSAAAMLFDLAGHQLEAEYFTKMVLASYTRREEGHTGHFFATQWGALAAARGGPEAAASFAKNTRYFTELERRYDGRCVYQPQLPDQSHKTFGYRTTGQRLQQYCLPRKKLYITGRGGSSVSPITGDELKRIVAAPFFDSRPLSSQELLAALGSELPPIREKAAIALGERDEVPMGTLIAMLKGPDRHARYGACLAIRHSGKESIEARDALVDILENNEDMTLRYFALEAIGKPEDWTSGEGEKVVDSLLKLATVYEPKQDPQRKLARFISMKLFSARDGWFPEGKQIAKLDQNLFLPALEELLTNPTGEARSAASYALNQLPKEQLDKIWGTVYESTTTAAPSGVMFADMARINGIEAMAKHNIEEGLHFGAWYTMYKRGWGGRIRRRALVELYPYGQALEPYFEKLEKAATTDSSFRGARKKNAIEGLAEARKIPAPKLISIEEDIESDPEAAFLKFMENWEVNKDAQ